MASISALSKTFPSFPLIYRISSISTASLDRYPRNKPSKFVHFLPEKIFFEPNKYYVISLHSLCIPTKRLPAWVNPSYIRIHLSELEHNIYSSPERIRVLSQLVLPTATEGEEDRDKDLHWFELSNPTPLLLDRTLPYVHELSFEFTDEHNRELELPSDSAPTILNCVIEEMDTLSRFTVTLNPTLSKHLYATNTDTNFRVTFGAPVTPGIGWEVALHSIIIPAGVQTAGAKFICKVTTVAGDEVIVYSKDNKGQNANEVINSLIYELSNSQVYIMRTSEAQYSITFESLQYRTNTTAVSVYFNPALANLLSIPDYKSGCWISEDTVSEQKMIPYGGRRFDPDRTIHNEEQIILYSDMVQTSVFGDHRAPLIDVLSTEKLGLTGKNSISGDVLYTVPNMTFRPVVKPDLKEINVRVTNIYGNQAEFEYTNPNAEIQYIFVFRK